MWDKAPEKLKVSFASDTGRRSLQIYVYHLRTYRISIDLPPEA